MIEMNKKYRSRDGAFTAEALCLDLKSDFPVAMLCTYCDDNRQIVKQFTKEGHYMSFGTNEIDLIEVSPYDHIKKGDVVIVWDGDRSSKFIQFFIEYKNNRVISTDCLNFENTRHHIEWDNCELYTGNK